jgi:dihydrofolate synthase/folylpolyglutamate synthase
MRFNTLDEWLAWQETLHPLAIDLGLERIRPVLLRLALQQPPCAVITVGGTNGKGSSVAMLDAILRAAGYRVGAYTSPHLLRYNERICIDGVAVDDATLCAAFERVDQARQDASLTYFEFGTLAAFSIFAAMQATAAPLDVVILEVGMGGRLDAVNLWDADVALVTAIGIDHTAWLGDTREEIAFEKAGIFRAGRPAVCGDPDPPHTLLQHADKIGAPLYRFGRDFGYNVDGMAWSWWSVTQRRHALPHPALRGPFQLQNAAGVLMVLELLGQALPLPVNQGDIRQGLSAVQLAGRFQVLPGMPLRILDVAHNPHGAQVLAQSLRTQPCAGQTHAVMSMLADKDIDGVISVMRDVIDVWHVAGLDVPRGVSGAQLAGRLQAAGITSVHVHASVTAAYQQAGSHAQPIDRVVVFGSFYTVAEVLNGG